MKEITINVIDETGKKHKIVTPLEMGLNLMDVLRSHDLVEGACGGMALCATCHCYIESDHQIANQKDDELAMLDQLFSVDDEKSRLACQILLLRLLIILLLKLPPLIRLFFFLEFDKQVLDSFCVDYFYYVFCIV